MKTKNKMNIKTLWSALKRGASSLSLFPRIEGLPPKSDAEAMADDWRRVGDDLREAMKKWESEHPEARRQREIMERGLTHMRKCPFCGAHALSLWHITGLQYFECSHCKKRA